MKEDEIEEGAYWDRAGPDRWVSSDGDKCVEVWEENDYYDIVLFKGGVSRSIGNRDTHEKAVRFAKDWMEDNPAIILEDRLTDSGVIKQ